MKDYLVGFNDDGTLILEPVTATDKDEARAKAQLLHSGLSIILVKGPKQGGKNG